MLSKLFMCAAIGAASTTSAVAMPVALRLSGEVVLSDSRAAVTGSRYTMTLCFDDLAYNHSREPGQGLYGGIDALVTGFDFHALTPSGGRVGSARHDLAATGSNSLVSVVDHPLGDNWYLALFGSGLRLADDDVWLPSFRFSVELGGGVDGVTSTALSAAPRAANFQQALMGFFHADGQPLLIGTVDRIDAVSPVPEPTTAALLAAGLAGLAAAARRRRPVIPAPAAS